MPRQKKQRLAVRADGRYKCSYHGHQFYGRDSDEAIAKRKAFMDAEARKEYSRENPTVAEYAERWLERQAAGAAYQTKKEKASLLKKLVAALGDMYLREVRPSDIKAIYSERFDGMSASYIRSASQMYRAIFDAAVEDGICATNPARQPSSRPHRGTVPETRALTDQEREWVETLCTDHRAHAAAMAMLYAGIRPQEAKALDIDRDISGDQITIRETVHLVGSNTYESSTKLKTAYSGRTVPLFLPLANAIRGKHGLLVQSASGKPVTVQAWRSVWESYVAALETAINGCQARWYGRRRQDQGKQLPPYVRITFTPYDLRHSFCTMCRDNGVELNTCIHWMGHADAKMILKVYDKFTPERGIKEAEKLTKKLFSGSSEGSNEKADAEAPATPAK